MLRLLVDTSVWLDIAGRRDGQKWIVPIRVLRHQGFLELLVPGLVLNEFDQNRPRAELAVTAQVRERFRLLRADLNAYVDDNRRREWLEELTHQVPMLSSRTLQNFAEISDLLRSGKELVPTLNDYARVIQRGLDKRAPLHLNKNSVADALLIELYRSALKRSRSQAAVYCFATSNYQDFSAPNEDRRLPHPDIRNLFERERSHFIYGPDGLREFLEEYAGHAYRELADETEIIQEEPRTFAEILEAEQEYFEKVWYVRNFIRSNGDKLPELLETVESKYGRDELHKMIGSGRDEAWQYGYANGKLATLRWVLGSEWDFLDT
jgi:PIN domain